MKPLSSIRRQLFWVAVAGLGMLSASNTTHAGFIVVANSADRVIAMNGTAAQAATKANSNVTIQFVDRIVGAANPTTGVSAGTSLSSAGSNAGLAANTFVYVVNTRNQSSGVSASQVVSFNLNSGALASSVPNPAVIGVGKALPVSLTLSAATAGAKQAVVGVHRGNPFTASSVKFPNAVMGPLTDINNTITVKANVFDHSQGSFSSSPHVTSLTLDFGTVHTGTDNFLSYSIFNNVKTAGFTAGLDLLSISGVSSPFSTNIGPFNNLAAGNHTTGKFAEFKPTSAGFFSDTITLHVSDRQSLLGATTYDLKLTLKGHAVPEPSSFAMATIGVLALGGLGLRRRRLK